MSASTMNPFHNKVVQFLVILVSLGLCLSSLRTIIDLWSRKDLVRLRQKDLTIITRENQGLEQKLKETQSDDYVERIARDKLGMVKEGESIVLLPETGVPFQTRVDVTPNWKKWLKLFF